MSDNINIFPEKIEEVQKKLIEKWQNKGGDILEKSDSRKLILDSMAYGFALLGQSFNQKIKQNLLRYSEGNTLDQLGYYKNVERLGEQPARVQVKFEMNKPLENILPIKPTRITSGDNVYFKTEYCEIPKNKTSVITTAVCQETGEIGNGYLAGEINKIIDPSNFSGKVSNITVSQGGAAVESDENYRKRIHIAPENYSVAGPEKAYRYWAKTANQSIIDVAVYQDEPGVVTVVPLLTNGEIPNEAILKQVSETLSASENRPLTDYVKVQKPVKVNYSINFTYYINHSDIALVSEIESNVKRAVEEYILWQKSKLNRDINPSELIYRLKKAGVKRVDLTEPKYQELDIESQSQNISKSAKLAVISNDPSYSYGGLEDD